ncbi:MAG: hypothetical protein M3041_10770 [Acidobacteriota bacterium]|nr:hypothetical protein [Acidobacteriota bacterium]
MCGCRQPAGATYTWSPWVNVASLFYVTNAASDGAGSFRDAITRANAVCLQRQQPCEIDFQISGEINLDTPLPAITAGKIAIDGKKQITLDGSGMQSPGVTINGEEITLSGFKIVNWGGAGILIVAPPRTSLRAAISDNEIRQNLRGVMALVAVSPQAKWTEVRGNSMKGNGQLGIDFALDLVTPNVDDDSTRPVPNAPVITSATYDSGKTVIIGHVDLRKPADVGFFLPIIDLYGSTSFDAQGEKPLTVYVDYGSGVGINSRTGDFVFTYNGDVRGQYITGTYTRMYLGKGVTANALQPRPQYYENWQATSEMSNPVRVAP